MMTAMQSHAYYKDLFQQLLNREELAYETTSSLIDVALPGRQVARVQTQVYLRGRLLTFYCPCLLRVGQEREAQLAALLNELNCSYPDIKFTYAEGAVRLTLQSFILKDRMVCQCLLTLKRLTEVADRVQTQIKYVLK